MKEIWTPKYRNLKETQEDSSLKMSSPRCIVIKLTKAEENPKESERKVSGYT